MNFTKQYIKLNTNIKSEIANKKNEYSIKESPFILAMTYNIPKRAKLSNNDIYAYTSIFSWAIIAD